MTENGRYLWLQASLLCFINLVNYMDRFNVSGERSEVVDRPSKVPVSFKAYWKILKMNLT